MKYSSTRWSGTYTGGWEGVISNLMRRYKQTKSNHIRNWIEQFMSMKPCPNCEGSRLKKESRSVTVNETSIGQLSSYPIKEIKQFFDVIKLNEMDAAIADQIIKEIKKNIYSSQIAFNVLPGANRPKLDNGYTEEEMKMTWEAQKILDESIQVTASCARVPVFYGHSEVVHIETELKINLEEMISKMQSFPGLKVINSDTEFNPTPLDDAEGKDEVLLVVLEGSLARK